MTIKSIYYASDEFNTNLLDNYNNDRFSLRKSEYTTDIQSFIKTKTDFLNRFNIVVLNRRAFIDTDNDFIIGLKAIIKLLDETKRLIIIWQGLKKSDIDTNLEASTFSLNNIGIGNICIDTDLEELRNEIRECFSDEGMRRYKVKDIGSIEQKKFIATKEEPIAIACIGITKYAGTTSLAYPLTNYLIKSGAKALYINEKEYNVFKKHLIGEESEEIFTTKDNVPIAKEFKDGYEFFIKDYGSIYNNNDLLNIKGDIEALEIKDLILIGSIDSFCIDNFTTNYRIFEPYSPYVLINQNHIKEDELKVEKLLSEIKHYAYFKRKLDWEDLTTNKTLYLDLVKKYQI